MLAGNGRPYHEDPRVHLIVYIFVSYVLERIHALQNAVHKITHLRCCCYESFVRLYCVRLGILLASKRLQVQVQSNTQNRKFAV